MRLDDVPLHYPDGARSVHTLLRINDPHSDRTDDVLIDNLATAFAVVAHYNLEIVEETIGRVPLPGADQFGASPGDDADLSQLTDPGESGVAPILHHWREYASGSPDETLIIVCHGDPDIISQVNTALPEADAA